MGEREFLERELAIKYDLFPLSIDKDTGSSKYFTLIAKKDFADVKAGDTGGTISRDVILSHDSDAWVYPNAVVDGEVVILGDSKIKGFTNIKAKKRLTIYNSTIEDSDIKTKHKLEIENSRINNGIIKSKHDFECLDPDEGTTAYIDKNKKLMMINDGFDKPYDLQLGLILINYSNKFDDILETAIKFKNKHRHIGVLSKMKKHIINRNLKEIKGE